MKSFFIKVVFVLAGVIVLGICRGCTYGEYEPDLWNWLTEVYNSEGDSDDDNDNNDDSASDSDSDSDSDLAKIPNHR
jgi:hypothetical protein